MSSYSVAVVSPCVPDQTGVKELRIPHNRNSTSPTGTKAAVAVECMFNMMVLASVSVRTRTPVKRAIGEYPTLG